MGVVVLEVEVVYLGIVRRAAALLTHVDLVSAFLVGKLELLTVHLTTVRLQRASLRKGFVAHHTLVWANTCFKKIPVFKNNAWWGEVWTFIFLLMYNYIATYA